jgi:acetyl esterase
MAQTGREPLLHELPVDEARRRALARAVEASGGGDPTVATEDRTVPARDGSAIPVRIYRPFVSAGGRAPGVVVFFHGGGWVYGDLDSHDGMCRDIAAASACVIMAVDYRLAPENPFPAGLEDALDVLDWTFRHVEFLAGDGANLAVAGDSSGGNLAAAASLWRRDAGLSVPKFQLLLYPCLDLTLSQPSMVAAGGKRFGGRSEIAWTVDRYLAGRTDPREPLVSPLWAEHHGGLPAAHVVTAGFDPLVDEAVAYVRALDAAGVSVSHRHYEEQIHGFLSFAGILPDAQEALKDASQVLRRGMGST